jgi:hypothetical protein
VYAAFWCVPRPLSAGSEPTRASFPSPLRVDDEERCAVSLALEQVPVVAVAKIN